MPASTGASRPAKKAAARKGALAAGAARASGERAKRRRTPLIAEPAEPDEATGSTGSARAAELTEPTPRVAEATAAAAATGRHTESVEVVDVDESAEAPRPEHRPRPVAKAVPTKKAVARSGTRAPKASGTRRPSPRTKASAERPVRALKAVPPVVELPETVLSDEQDAPQGVPPRTSVTPGLEELLGAGIAAVRTTAEAAGVSPDDVERHLASLLAFARRRLTGDFTVDDFGFDEDFTESFYLPVLRPLYRHWFRVEVRGIENIPATGGGLVVANHSGTVAMDSLMTQVAVHDEHPAHRHLRMLGADLVFQTPVMGTVARKSGSTLAANPDAERLLSSGELCGVWPEGFKGVGKPFSERYKLQRFGRGGFVSAALKTGVPIIPCSIVGAEEIYPILGNMKTVARLIGVPYAPITPTWPLLGPLGWIPLPSKWIIEFGAPVETADLGPGAADDPMLVFDLTDQVRETIQQTLYSLLMQRRSVFF